MYIFITHFFAEYVIFKYFASNITCRINYTAPFFRSSRHLASFLHPSLDIYPALFLSYSIIFDSLRRSVM